MQEVSSGSRQQAGVRDDAAAPLPFDSLMPGCDSPYLRPRGSGDEGTPVLAQNAPGVRCPLVIFLLLHQSVPGRL